MIRLVLYLVCIAAITLGIGFFAEYAGKVTLEWFGYQVETSVIVALIMMGVFFAGIYLAVRLLMGIFRFPGRLRGHMRLKKEEKRVFRLSRVITAHLEGDKQSVQKLAGRSAGLMRVLKAEALLEEGKLPQAKALLIQAEGQEETALASLKMLYRLSIEEGNKAAVAEYLAKAEKRDSRLGWVVEGRLKGYCSRRHWEEALRLLGTLEGGWRGDNTHTFPSSRLHHLQAALFFLLAEQKAVELNDKPGAIPLLEKALASDSAFIPAALMLGECYNVAGKNKKALSLLKGIWQHSPHPDITEIYHALIKDEPLSEQRKKIESLIESGAQKEGAFLLMAEVLLEEGAFEEAESYVKRALERGDTARACQLMAEIMLGKGAQEHAVLWMRRSSKAPAEGAWICGHCGELSPSWQILCAICGELDSISWKWHHKSINNQGKNNTLPQLVT